jgi:glycosyltransferase involved in cell wall biosynthesis
MISLPQNSSKTIHPYISERIQDLHNGLYPKNHLWGVDIFDQEKNFPSRIVPKMKLPTFVNRLFKRLLLSNSSPGLDIELSALNHSYSNSVIYSVCGPLSFVRIFGKAKLFCWVFSEPKDSTRSFFHPYNPKNLEKYSGILCLTPTAEKYFSQFAPSKFIPWCVDTEIFDGKSPEKKTEKPFFLASGKTGRDYGTLIDAANKIQSEIRIIGPKDHKPKAIPQNVKWVETSTNPPDQAINYPTLREWYSQCIAVCIPLSGDADDTCGYTNMLEAMAMRKPVLMTQSGCLHINPETNGFGIQIKPRDAEGWAHAMNHLHHDHEKALGMGNRGRKIVEQDFTIERFNNDVLRFVDTILEKS